MTDKPWYAVRLFGMRARAIEEAFKTEGFRTFIPMHYEDYEDANGHHKRRLRPVVSNLLFVEVQGTCILPPLQGFCDKTHSHLKILCNDFGQGDE